MKKARLVLGTAIVAAATYRAMPAIVFQLERFGRWLDESERQRLHHEPYQS